MSSVTAPDRKLVPLGVARKELIPPAPSGKPISPGTLWRWAREGLLVASGERVRLRVTMVGGRPYLTREDVDAFFSKLTEAREAALGC